MKLTKRDPLREIEDKFERYGRTIGKPRRTSQEVMMTGNWAPRVDIAETDREFTIKAEIPEVRKEDVKYPAHRGVDRRAMMRG